MNYLLSETFNIDTVIQNIQKSIYDNLDWKFDVDGYGRVYKNEKDGVVIPEVYLDSLQGYKSVYYNDKSSFFFIDGNTHTTEDEMSFNTSCKIVFMVNLDHITNSFNRLDAMVRRDVISVLRNHQYDFTITGYETTLDEVFRGFDTSKLMRSDIHPYHVFAITGTINYLITDKC